MKLAFVLVVYILVVILAIFVFRRKPVKNKVSHVAGWGDCPSCGDSWSRKESGSIDYAPGWGIMICKECLQHSDRLDVNKIVRRLREDDWAKDEIELVRTAVMAYKAKLAH